MANRIQFRRDMKANWEQYNPILADGEIGIEKDTQRFKLGDGITHWIDLIYSSSLLKDDPVNLISRLQLNNAEYDTSGKLISTTYSTGNKVEYVYTGSVLNALKYYDTDGTTLVVTERFTYNSNSQLIKTELIGA